MVHGLAKGLWWNLPVRAYLVRTPDALFLFDTGMPECLSRDLWCLLGEEDTEIDPDQGAPRERIDGLVPVLRPSATLRSRLTALGLTPDALDAVIVSHTHFDHAGGLDVLRGRPVLLQAAEIAAAFPSAESDASQAGRDPDAFWLRGTHRLEPVSGDRELAPGVTLLATPGHTPGHQSLLVETAQGAFLLTSDAVYTQVNWDTEVPGAMWNTDVGAQSVARLREVARDTGATVLFGHDAVQAKIYRALPHWYGA